MPDHPLAHIPDETAHRWMREDCAALDAARQAREDNLMNVIIQTSSAAVLAIPGLFIAADVELPRFSAAWPIYVSALAFALAFASACIEQVLSGRAYAAQRRVAEEYYTRKSVRTSDERATWRADLARSVALAIFAAAVTLGALGLAQFARGPDGKATTSSANAALKPGSASTLPPNTGAPSDNTAATRNPGQKVEPRNDSAPAAPTEKGKVN